MPHILDHTPRACSKELDWENPNFDELGNFDVILVADCVYDPDLIVALVAIIKTLLKEAKDAGRESIAIVATTKRQPRTFQFFLETLAESSLTHVDITPAKSPPSLFVTPPAEIVLSKIFL